MRCGLARLVEHHPINRGFSSRCDQPWFESSSRPLLNVILPSLHSCFLSLSLWRSYSMKVQKHKNIPKKKRNEFEADTNSHIWHIKEEISTILHMFVLSLPGLHVLTACSFVFLRSVTKCHVAMCLYQLMLLRCGRPIWSLLLSDHFSRAGPEHHEPGWGHLDIVAHLECCPGGASGWPRLCNISWSQNM